MSIVVPLMLGWLCPTEYTLAAQDIPLQAENASESALVEKITTQPEGDIIADGKTCEKISSAVLKGLCGTDKQLILLCDGYAILLSGRDIRNTGNELDTKIPLSLTGQGLEMIINDGNNMPGQIRVEIFGQTEYRHLYVYNAARDTYQEIGQAEGRNRFTVDVAGRYMMTQQPISEGTTMDGINGIIVLALGGVALGVLIAYVAVKKRHWFW